MKSFELVSKCWFLSSPLTFHALVYHRGIEKTSVFMIIVLNNGFVYDFIQYNPKSTIFCVYIDLPLLSIVVFIFLFPKESCRHNEGRPLCGKHGDPHPGDAHKRRERQYSNDLKNKCAQERDCR